MPNAVAIKSMFNSISGSYDLLNDLLSLGLHRLWKKELVSELTSSKPNKVLDCATGTGDIAISIKKTLPASHIHGIDFSKNMLEVAKNKTDDIQWSQQDVMNLPFSNNEFDTSCISYGIRNVEDYTKALTEMARVTSDKICILEFGQPKNKLFRKFYFGVMRLFIPLMGFFFNKREAYEYLIDSSEKFPSHDDFAKVIGDATGFTHVTYRPFFGGITYLYTASNSNE